MSLLSTKSEGQGNYGEAKATTSLNEVWGGSQGGSCGKQSLGGSRQLWGEEGRSQPRGDENQVQRTAFTPSPP